MPTLSQYLFAKLQGCGVDTTFGIPGDFCLPLYAAQNDTDLRTVVCTHEPSCVFAADAYARMKGLGAVITTYGVGGLNMVNPIAMAYAEHSPVVVVSGAPEIAGRSERPFVHHLVKHYDTQFNVMQEVTGAAAVLDNPRTAAAEIERVIDTAVREKRPVYLEIPRDMTNVEVDAPELDDGGSLSCPTGFDMDDDALAEAVDDIKRALKRAERPVLFTGVGVRRYNLTEAVVKLAEALDIPVVSSVMGKASFPESHPLYRGVYMGKLGDDTARETAENADLVISLGVIFSDTNTGFFTMDLSRARQIHVRDYETRVSHHSYNGVPMTVVVRALVQSLPGTGTCTAPHCTKAETPDIDLDGPLTNAALVAGLSRLDPKSHGFIADVGDCWFTGLELTADVFMAPGYYASMGFAVPGGLGLALAEGKEGRRPVILVGDGAFQMTGTELSTLVKEGLSAIIIVLNNAEYKMLSTFDAERDYYKLNNWDYVAFAQSMGAQGARTDTPAHFARALMHAVKTPGVHLIEAILPPTDHPPIMARIRKHFEAKRKG